MCIEIGFKPAHVNQTRQHIVLAQHRFHEAVDDLLSRSAIERSTSLCPFKKALHRYCGFGVDRMRQSQIRQRRYAWSIQWAVVDGALSQPLCRPWLRLDKIQAACWVNRDSLDPIGF